MKRLFFSILSFVLITFCISGCKMAPSNNNGDTVAASVFTPVDTARFHKLAVKEHKAIKDSTDIFIVGNASDRHNLQLITYPTQRDTLTFARAHHIKVRGNADFGHIVRIKFYINGTDTLISNVDEIKIKGTSKH